MRQQLAFYASTPSCRTLLDRHGWADVGTELGEMAVRVRWAEMGTRISDEMLAAFAVEGETLAEAAQAINERYTGLLDRVAFYLPFIPGERDAEWAAALAILHATP